jgi:large subunit ribosomal protein L31
MKKDIHPKYKMLKVKIGTDVFELMSAYQGGDELLMDVDYRKHPAWTGGGVQTANESDKNINAFNQKFAGLFGAK